jgi:hypothetical protein
MANLPTEKIGRLDSTSSHLQAALGQAKLGLVFPEKIK